MNVKDYLLAKKEDIKNLDVKERKVEVKENRNFAIAVVGPRRAGKTYFLYDLIRRRNLKDEDFIFMNFEETVDVDNPVNLPIIHQEIYRKMPEYIFLDEVQALKNWERTVYTLYEKKRYYIFITGSSSKLLSKEIASKLRGRTTTLRIYPFSFKEIFAMEGIERKRYYSPYEAGKIKNIVHSNMDGMFPDIVLGNIEPSVFYRDYVNLVIYRDIMERYGVRNRYALELFIRGVISSHTKLFSVNKFFNTLKSRNMRVSKKILYGFQKMLEDVGFVTFLRKFSWSIRKTELTEPKVYLVDNGIYRFVEGKRENGKFLESAFLQELCKTGYEPNRDVFYWRDGQGNEVDFVVKEGTTVKELIQVTYARGKDEIEKREIRALLKASEELKCKNLKIITWDYEDKEIVDRKTIVYTPLWKWLLEK